MTERRLPLCVPEAVERLRICRLWGVGTPYVGSESRLQRAAIRWCRLHPSPAVRLTFAIPNGGARERITGAILRAEGVARGVPDLFCPLPRNGRHGIFLELKTSTGRVSPDQWHWLTTLERNGYECLLIRSLDALPEAFP